MRGNLLANLKPTLSIIASCVLVNTQSTCCSSDHKKNEKKIITCLGAAGLDAVATVAEFPKVDDKIRTTSILFGGGGNAANTCTAISRLGFNAKLISKVGSDVNGNAVLSELQKDGVNTDQVQVSSDGSSTMFTYVIVDSSTASRTCISTPIAHELSRSDGEDALRRLLSTHQDVRPRILHLDSRHTEAAYYLLRGLHNHNPPPQEEDTSSSPPSSLRPLISIDAEKDRPPYLRKLLPLCDVIFTNERFAQLYVSTPLSSSPSTAPLLPAGEDTELLCQLEGCSADPTLDEEDRTGEALTQRLQLLTQLFKNSSAKIVVSTLGAKGSLLVRRRSRPPSPPSSGSSSSSESVLDMLRRTIPGSLEALPSLTDEQNPEEELSISSLELAQAELFSARRYLFRCRGEEFDVLRCSASKAAYEVRDTTGAGDAFIGGFLVALLTQSHTYMSLTRGGDSEQKEDDLDEELVVLLRCLQFGSLVAAEAIQGIGAR